MKGFRRLEQELAETKAEVTAAADALTLILQAGVDASEPIKRVRDHLLAQVDQNPIDA